MHDMPVRALAGPWACIWTGYQTLASLCALAIQGEICKWPHLSQDVIGGRVVVGLCCQQLRALLLQVNKPASGLRQQRLGPDQEDWPCCFGGTCWCIATVLPAGLKLQDPVAVHVSCEQQAASSSQACRRADWVTMLFSTCVKHCRLYRFGFRTPAAARASLAEEMSRCEVL